MAGDRGSQGRIQGDPLTGDVCLSRHHDGVLGLAEIIPHHDRRAQTDGTVIRSGLDDQCMSEHSFDGLDAAVEKTQLAPGIVVAEVLPQITFGAGGGNSLDDFRTLGVDEFAHFGDERGLAVCGEQNWFTECHLMISGTGVKPA
ncbi:MAG: hypothetical protein WB805_06685 [Candidatus Dormiibacterota bacterium]